MGTDCFDVACIKLFSCWPRIITDWPDDPIEVTAYSILHRHLHLCLATYAGRQPNLTRRLLAFRNRSGGRRPPATMVQPCTARVHQAARHSPVAVPLRQRHHHRYAVGALALRSLLVPARRLQSRHATRARESAVPVAAAASLSRRSVVPALH